MCLVLFFFKQKTAYEMRISDWSSDVCSSDLPRLRPLPLHALAHIVALIFAAIPQRLFEPGLVVAEVGKAHRRALHVAHRVAVGLQHRVGPAHELAIGLVTPQPPRRGYEALGRGLAIVLKSGAAACRVRVCTDGWLLVVPVS